MRGVIKRLAMDRGFGFITPDGGARDDYFFHRSGLARDGKRFDELREGERVEFEEEGSPKGPRATSIRVI